MKKTSFVRLGLATVTALLLTATAQAVPINGTIGFGGDVAPVGGSGTFSDATGVDILLDRAVVVTATGDFDGLFGSSADFYDFSLANPPTAGGPLWSVGGFSFNLDSILIKSKSNAFMEATGTGVLLADGFDVTPATWSFSLNSSSSGTGPAFSFSSQNSNVAPIPEPATMILLGSGLLGVAGTVRRRKK